MFSGSTLCQANLGQGTFSDQEPSKLVAISVALCGDCENQRKVDLPCLTCHHRRDFVDRYKSTELLPQHPALASLVVGTYSQAFIRTSWSFLQNKTDCPSTVTTSYRLLLARRRDRNRVRPPSPPRRNVLEAIALFKQPEAGCVGARSVNHACCAPEVSPRSSLPLLDCGPHGTVDNDDQAKRSLGVSPRIPGTIPLGLFGPSTRSVPDENETSARRWLASICSLHSPAQ